MQKTLLLLLIFLWATDLIAQDPFHKKGFELDIDLMAPLGEYKGFGGLARFDFWQVDRNWGSTKSALRFIMAQESNKSSEIIYNAFFSPNIKYDYSQKNTIFDLAMGIEQQFYFNRSRLYFGGDFFFYKGDYSRAEVITIFENNGTIASITRSNPIYQSIYTGIAPFAGYSFFIQKWLSIGTELSLPLSFSYARKFNTGNYLQNFEFDIWARLSRLLYIGFHF
jgi:hypothetical protein